MSPFALFFLSIPVILLIAKAASSRTMDQERKYINRLFSELVDLFHFRYRKGSFLSYPALYGEIEGTRISLKRMSDPDFPYPYIRVFVTHQHKVDRFFHIFTRGSLANDFEQVFMYTRDHEFDQKVTIISTLDQTVLALLSFDVREKIKTLAAGTYRFDCNSTWASVHCESGDNSTVEKMKSFIQLLQSISKEVSSLHGISARDVKERLIKNIVCDPVHSCRIKNVEELVKHWPLDQDVIEALRECLQDEDISVQIGAARYLSREGMKHLEKLLSDPGNFNADMAVEIIEIFAQHRHRESLSLLLDVYKKKPYRKVRLEILRALAVIGGPTAEPLLLKQLQKGDSVLTRRAVMALGLCGTVKAVEPLNQLGRKVHTSFLQNEIKKAVSRIQERLGSVERGWLSISDNSGTEGALSIAADAEEGALSIDTEKE